MDYHDKAFTYIYEENYDKLSKLLEERKTLGYSMDLEVENNYGTTLLIESMGFNIRITELLLECGADPDHRTTDGISPIYCGISVDFDKTFSILRLLLKYGANIDAKSEGCSPLYFACCSQDVILVELLLENGANPNTRTSYHERRTALMTAFLSGNSRIFSLLLKYGANMYAEDDYRKNIFHYTSNINPTCAVFRDILNKNPSVPTLVIMCLRIIRRYKGMIEIVNMGGNDRNSEYGAGMIEIVNMGIDINIPNWVPRALLEWPAME